MVAGYVEKKSKISIEKKNPEPLKKKKNAYAKIFFNYLVSTILPKRRRRTASFQPGELILILLDIIMSATVSNLMTLCEISTHNIAPLS